MQLLRQLARAVNVVDLKKEAGKTFSYAELEAALKEHKPAVLFLCQVMSCGGGPLHAKCAVPARKGQLVSIWFLFMCMYAR